MKRAWLATVIVTGFSLSGFCAPNNTAPVPSKVTEAGAAPRDAKVEDLVSSLNADLKLSKAQQEQVRAELTKTKADYAALQKEITEKRQALMSNTNTRLAAILKADQKKKFEAAHGIDAQGRYTPSVPSK